MNTQLDIDDLIPVGLDRRDILEWISAIESKISTLHEDFIEQIPKATKKLLFSIAHYKDEVRQLTSNPVLDAESLILALDKLRMRSKEMRASIDSDVPISKGALAAVEDVNYTILKKYEELVDLLAPLKERERNSPDKEIAKLSSALQIIRQQLNDLQSDNNRSRQAIAKNQRSLEKSEEDLSGFEGKMNDALNESKAQADTVLTELLEKQKEINDLVGTLAGETTSGSYAKSASVEKKTADTMRNSSVALMLTIVGIIGYSLFETARPHFEWETALARLVFSIALSVPAAYLARESSKHRVQQYTYLRVSLDLQAIPPYLASLPTEEQNRLRGGIADRIFGAKDSISSADSYPLNLQELLMGIISKLEFPKKSSESKEK